uniref:Tail tube protein n=1 Tax=Siphoviridae sp. ctt5z12 TaxID=2823604 RepID=A0A8S5LBV5_9CAUD|nr:MAG TPA: tail tube protein [Siphoviridae sp. ctt5z12]DAP61601.1 MAG TPA: tail tube protein [Caudoviricetes sp.]
MAANLEVTDAQLTKFYICDTGVDLGDATKIKTALTSAKRIAYLEDLGDFTKTRETTEYKCIDEDAVAVSQGSVSYGETELKLFYKAGQDNGVNELSEMFDKKQRKQFIIVGDDEPATGATKHPTYITGEFINTKAGITINKGDVIRVPAVIKITRLDKIIPASA